MKVDDILRECERAELMAAQYGNMSDAYLVLRVKGARHTKTARIVPGLYGRVLGNSAADGEQFTMVMVYCKKIREWFKKRGVE